MPYDFMTALLAGLDDDERARTLKLLSRRAQDDLQAAARGRLGRNVDFGTRTRATRAERARAQAQTQALEGPSEPGWDTSVPRQQPDARG